MARTLSPKTTILPVADPEYFAPALAHVVRRDGAAKTIIGQAWLAGEGKLITCGHVVEEFVESPLEVSVEFPFSGNIYPVWKIELHPSFVRQRDQLVKFDVALLTAELSSPEGEAEPLPFAYERAVRTGQALEAVRYPIHLGELSAAPHPLAQEGRLLGQLRKHDSFHLLHDLALAPGDSGAPIFDGTLVVAIHCGDTATLPGLNLPTTSIRLMLWVDALRELDIPETAALSRRMSFRRVLSVFVAFLLPLAAAFLIVGNSMLPEIQERWAIEEPALGPVQISFNKPVASYKYRDEVKIDLVPKTSCYLYLFDITNEHDPVIMLHPIVGFSAFVRAGHERSITDFGPSRITVGEWPSKLHLVALISDDPLVQKSYQAKFLPQSNPLRIDGGALLERIDDFKRRSPDGVLHLVLNAPRADIGEEES